jgi:AcrR family transcriptional regulator
MGGQGTLRAVRSWSRAPGDQQILDAVLLAVGEQGYGQTCIRDVLARAGVSRARFRQSFESMDDCFAAAYEIEAERLCDSVLAAGRRGSSWREGFSAALAELLDFVAAEPLRARALMLEAVAARGRAWAKNEEVIERLTRAVDSARHETGSRHRAPLLTGKLMVGAIESSVLRLIIAGEEARAPSLLADLTNFVVLNYFGEEAADEELGDVGGNRGE